MISQRQLKNKRFFFHASVVFKSQSFTNLPQEQQWEILLKSLRSLSSDYEMAVHALVLMKTHFHLLFSIDRKVEHFFMKSLENRIRDISFIFYQQEVEENVFESPFYCEPVQHIKQYKETYRYIYRNPLEAGLVAKCQEYEFSTLNTQLSKQCTVGGPIVDQLNLIQNPYHVLKWLHQETVVHSWKH